jgi:CubicO group peptidase (beta-lactamase class C family)
MMQTLKKQTIQHLLWIGWIVWACISLLGCSVIPDKAVKPETAPPVASPTPTSPISEPFTDWRTSTPEEQGMDSTSLAKMLAYVQDKKLNIHSILVFRNGFIVSEAYLPPFKADVTHDLASCAKTVVSSLIGIAIDKGYLKSTDQKMVDFFTDRTIANNDAAKQSITLKDMLTMSSGMDFDEWRPVDARSTFFQMQQSPDPVQFVLDRKMTDKPGKRFNYSEGMFNLLSIIVAQSSQMSVPDFAQKYLFEPTGINGSSWRPNAGGGYAFSLTPRDMARYAMLYLNKGAWNGKQVISSSWVNESTAKYIQTVVSAQDYGYLWWLPPFGGYAADGDGGQRIYVIPDKNLIVIINAGLLYPEMETAPETLVNTYILPAVKSSRPLPENTAGVAQMNSLIQALAKPVVKPVPPQPATAGLISGKTYTLRPNSIGMEKVSFNFRDQTAEVELGFAGRSQKMAIGLDNTYHINQIVEKMGPIYGWMAFRGSWETENRFAFDLLLNGQARRMIFQFTDDNLKLWLKGSRGETEQISGSASTSNP